MNRLLQTALLFPILLIVLTGGIGCSTKPTEEDYLVKVKDNKISSFEYERLLQAAIEEDFPGEGAIDPTQLEELRLRVLNQISEELIIAERAKAIGINISPEELQQSIDAIKSDYPDDTFESTLLENAIPFDEWKKKLAMRLLVEKVIEKELVDKVEITNDDVTNYYRKNFPGGPAVGDAAESVRMRIINHLRRQKAEDNYKNWIEGLRQAYSVDINRTQWNKVLDKTSQKKSE
jgi:hypothetical protein